MAGLLVCGGWRVCARPHEMCIRDSPYDGALRELRVTAVYPEGYAGYLREGVAVKLSDRNTGNVYTCLLYTSRCV